MPFDPSVSLSTLNGTNGFVILENFNYITGIFSYIRSISSVSSGDINGDGIADVLIGASTADVNAQIRAGKTHVVFGTRSGFPANLALSSLNGSNGFTLTGINVMDYSGRSVSSGDINGDGIADVLIGANTAQAQAGQTYVIFGTRSGFPANMTLSSLNGSNGFTLTGINANSFVSSGDINGDGIADVLIGANTAQAQAGQTYVVFGTRSGFPANMTISSLNGSNGFTLTGINADDRSGSFVSSGDINGDGIADVLIGAPGRVQTYVVFGRRSGFPANLPLSSLNGSNGFTLTWILNGQSGSSGDINGDGIADVLIGGPGFGRGQTAYVVFGRRSGFPANLDISSLNGDNGFTLTVTGWSNTQVSSGDINGDGIADMLIGAYSLSKGQTYMVFGRRSGFPANLDISSLNGSDGFAIGGGDYSVISVSSGDINGDSIADVVIGASAFNNDQGPSYVVFGGQSIVPTSDASLLKPALPDLASSLLLYRTLWQMGKNAVRNALSYWQREEKPAAKLELDQLTYQQYLEQLAQRAGSVYYLSRQDNLRWQVEDLQEDLARGFKTPDELQSFREAVEDLEQRIGNYEARKARPSAYQLNFFVTTSQFNQEPSGYPLSSEAEETPPALQANPSQSLRFLKG